MDAPAPVDHARGDRAVIYQLQQARVGEIQQCGGFAGGVDSGAENSSVETKSRELPILTASPNSNPA